MTDILIQAEGLSKRYIIGHQAQRERYTSLREVLMRRLRTFARKASDLAHGRAVIEGDELEEVWALRDVSFAVRRGEVLGIIGRNGAGKSTLLKILSRITEPTTGRVLLRGRVASLLEVGTGFHLELTGRENIFLNGAILGMSRAEIHERFDEIVAFAEIEKFLDTPVKRYSSGMYVRLAFAVAAHLEPEILIVDEVLAVGDIEFQRKCLGKMKDVAAGLGRTVLFVSHNMASVQALCSSAILLEAGAVATSGRVEDVVRGYLERFRPSSAGGAESRITLGEDLELDSLTVKPEFPAAGSPASVEVTIRCKTPSRLSDLSLLIFSESGQRIAIADTRTLSFPIVLVPGQVLRLRLLIPRLPFVEGEYRMGLFAVSNGSAFDIRDIALLSILPRAAGDRHAPYALEHRGVVELEFEPIFTVGSES